MGANFNTHMITAKDEKTALAEADCFMDAERHENGHGPYTGHLGTAGGRAQVLRQKFETAKAAQDWIEENHSKSEPPYLVHIEGERWLLAGWCRS